MFFFWRKLKKHEPAREKLLREYEKKISYRFKDLNLLNIALTHPSYLNENNIKDQEHYERMEFLGDSVLGLIVCSHIYKEFPGYSEGELSDIKSHVVSEKSLATIARRMGLGKFILLGSGEARSGGRRKNSILANVFEAVLGAVFLDGGYDSAKKYVLKFSKDDIVIHPPNRESSNYKGLLQKQCQLFMGADPNYRIVEEKGPSHSRVFVIEVWARNCKLGEGKGRSKKEAEQNSAQEALKYMEGEEFQEMVKGLGEAGKAKSAAPRSRKRKKRKSSPT